MTNFERIKNSSVEELIKILNEEFLDELYTTEFMTEAELTECDNCEYYDEEYGCMKNQTRTCSVRPTTTRFKDWLLSEDIDIEIENTKKELIEQKARLFDIMVLKKEEIKISSEELDMELLAVITLEKHIEEHYKNK